MRGTPKNPLPPESTWSALLTPEQKEALEMMTAFIMRSPEAFEEFRRWWLMMHPIPDHNG